MTRTPVARILGHQLIALAAAILPLSAFAADAGAEKAFIMGLPKAELHVHLEGTMEPELYLAMARRNDIATPYATADEVRDRLRAAHDLPSFIVIYEELIGAARTAQDFHDIALAYFRKAHSQGVVYAEVYFDPQLHLERGVSLATLYEGLAAAQADARSQLGLEAHYILSFLRDRSAEDAAKVLEASRPWFGDLVIGVGLDNPEVKGFPAKFESVFARAAELGLHRTSHCDVDQADTIANHWGVIEKLKVERIDHGLNVPDDPALVEAIRARGIGLTGAPTLFYREMPGRMEYRAGRIKALLDLGLLVSVNSDDPGMKRSLYVGDLMDRVRETTGMSRADIVRLARNSFLIAWISETERDGYLSRIEQYVAQAGPS